jgi:hypothetical protein
MTIVSRSEKARAVWAAYRGSDNSTKAKGQGEKELLLLGEESRRRREVYEQITIFIGKQRQDTTGKSTRKRNEGIRQCATRLNWKAAARNIEVACTVG